MASAKRLVLTSSVLCSVASIQHHTPCSLTPLLTQLRHKSQKNQRYRAPTEPKHKEKYTKVLREKSANVKNVRSPSKIFLARVPVDDVWIRAHYPRPKFSLEECLERHREFADPSMLDNMDGFIYADMQLNMKTQKKTKFLSNIKSTILLPHQFQQNLQQKIAIFCKTEEDVEKAKSLGASFVGCEDLVKQVQDGLVDKDDIDVVLCTADAITDLIPIRAQLRDKFPNKAKGNIGADIEEMWTLYTQGVTFVSQKESESVGRLQVPLGQLKQSVDELAANFNAYVESMCKGRAKNLGPLITQIFLVAPPSPERFLLQIENHVPGYEKTNYKQEDSDSEDEAEG